MTIAEGTIAENIAPNDPTADDIDIIKAASQHVHTITMNYHKVCRVAEGNSVVKDNELQTRNILTIQNY